jgi:formylglycine-generating enzyme
MFARVAWNACGSQLVCCFLAAPLLLGVGEASAQVTFDWVTVGNPGNLPDTLVMDKGSVPDMTTGYGAVDYTFRISRTHVTNSQYVQFLNAVDPTGLEANPILNDSGGIYNFNMTAFRPSSPLGLAHQGGIDFDSSAPEGSKYSPKVGKENFPAIWINWNSAARFVNWLSDGQGSGDMESGVYNNIPTDSTMPVPVRQPGSTIFLPSEDEFYKAAYYDPTKNDGAGGYWQYGTRSDTPPVSEAPAGGPHSANYATDAGLLNHASGDLFWQSGGTTFDKNIEHLTEVGAYTSATSYYGLYDVDGLAYQWTEDGRKVPSVNPYEFPVFRGGSWSSNEAFMGAAYRHLYSFPYAASYATFGFRVASLVPEGSLDGDFNSDGIVDGSDLLQWQRGDYAAADLALWEANFGATSAAPAAAIAAVQVPETLPATLVALMGLMATSLRNRQQS